MTQEINLPPLPGGIELQKVSMRGPAGVGEAMQQYARAALAQQPSTQDREDAERYRWLRNKCNDRTFYEDLFEEAPHRWDDIVDAARAAKEAGND